MWAGSTKSNGKQWVCCLAGLLVILVSMAVTGCNGVTTSAGGARVAHSTEAWPMAGQNPAHTGRSPNSGPGRPSVKIKIAGNPTTGPIFASDGTGFVGAREENGPYEGVVAFSPDGSKRWIYKINAREQGSIGSLALGSDTIFLTVAKPSTRPSAEAGAIIALEYTGKRKWVFKTGDRIKSQITLGGDGTIYCAGDRIYAIAPDGAKKWVYEIGDEDYYMVQAPALGENGIIYVSAFAGKSQKAMLLGLTSKGELKFKTELEGPAGAFPSAPAIGNGGTVYLTRSIASRGWLYSFNEDGSRKWQTDTGFTAFLTPAIGRDGTIYLATGDPNSKPGGLQAFSPDGKRKWVYETRSAILASPVIDKDGSIYISTQDGRLHAVRPNGTRKWIVKTNHLLSFDGFTLPIAIGHETIGFVGGGEELKPALYLVKGK